MKWITDKSWLKSHLAKAWAKSMWRWKRMITQIQKIQLCHCRTTWCLYSGFAMYRDKAQVSQKQKEEMCQSNIGIVLTDIKWWTNWQYGNHLHVSVETTQGALQEHQVEYAKQRSKHVIATTCMVFHHLLDSVGLSKRHPGITWNN